MSLKKDLVDALSERWSELQFQYQAMIDRDEKLAERMQIMARMAELQITMDWINSRENL